ncbi:hypothetical protein [uncultured Paracoccus sp.]|uniref:hypothetical protein n=1 Tax=uncultured Paracoccus sp. TaxID=189685 RepID=UPI0026189FC1|nr:hypothetical protein [uncultured Paracoccus sp.]
MTGQQVNVLARLDPVSKGTGGDNLAPPRCQFRLCAIGERRSQAGFPALAAQFQRAG